MRTRPLIASAALVLSTVLVASTVHAAPHPSRVSANAYRVHRLVADRPGAVHLDPNLVNGWGLAAGPTTPWWVADNETDVSTLYDGDGNQIPLVVKVAGAPTGTVFNGSGDFMVSRNGVSGASLFLFATESGKIRGWNPNVPGTTVPSTKAFTVASRTFAEANYKGLAISSSSMGNLLYATDFHNGRVDVFDADFDRVLRHAFVDPGIPDGYGPFGIQALGGSIYVTYAKQDADAEDEVAGAGLGFVDRFSPQGVLERRVASRHSLNAPWGLAWAPSEFGKFSGDLLVGNFGDGRITAYGQKTDGGFVNRGPLRNGMGDPIAVDGLWAIAFGNDAAAGPSTSLFFTAGPDDEEHGLFGRIDHLG